MFSSSSSFFFFFFFFFSSSLSSLELGLLAERSSGKGDSKAARLGLWKFQIGSGVKLSP